MAIVNRSFLPGTHALFDALFAFAQRVACSQPVCIITELDSARRDTLKAAFGDHDVDIMACNPRSDSSSGLIQRGWDAAVFMAWTLFSLIKCRPAKIYVSTNPPILVPFIVFIYSKLSGSKYYYHLQDIHPEATNIIVPIPIAPYRFIRWIDSITMRHAAAIITLSEAMRECISVRSDTPAPIHLLDNPAARIPTSLKQNRNNGFVFCGNAGRLQRIPLVIDSIKSYLDQGGALQFAFAGAGLFAPQIAQLAETYDSVTFHGAVSADEASQLMNQHNWALMPIEDEVTCYAFPSKSSSYVLAGCKIIAICGRETSLGQWVEAHGLGYVLRPDKKEIIGFFRKVEAGHITQQTSNRGRDDLKHMLTIEHFVNQLHKIMGLDRASGCRGRLRQVSPS